MAATRTQISGKKGAQYIVRKVKCPNCGAPLMELRTNMPLFDVACTKCIFRAQVKTNEGKPKKEIFGAGWEVLEKTLKAGYPIPPLIVHFWKKHRAGSDRLIRFYPFITTGSVRKRRRNTGPRKHYREFNYRQLDVLPHFQWDGVEWIPGTWPGAGQSPTRSRAPRRNSG